MHEYCVQFVRHVAMPKASKSKWMNQILCSSFPTTKSSRCFKPIGYHSKSPSSPHNFPTPKKGNQCFQLWNGFFGPLSIGARRLFHCPAEVLTVIVQLHWCWWVTPTSLIAWLRTAGPICTLESLELKVLSADEWTKSGGFKTAIGDWYVMWSMFFFRGL